VQRYVEGRAGGVEHHAGQEQWRLRGQTEIPDQVVLGRLEPAAELLDDNVRRIGATEYRPAAAVDRLHVSQQRWIARLLDDAASEALLFEGPQVLVVDGQQRRAGLGPQDRALFEDVPGQYRHP
jgi:hypothetical protein